MGAICAGFVGFALAPAAVLHLLLAILAGSGSGGAVWGFIAGLLKARTGAHEVIVTIMLNYIALYFLLSGTSVKGVPRARPYGTRSASRAQRVRAVPDDLLGDSLRVNLGIILAVLAAAGVAWLLNRARSASSCARSAPTRTPHARPA